MSLLDKSHMPYGSKIVVACSGGGDSVALLYMMAGEARERGWQLTVAHLDHGLREESGQDAAFTAEIAAELDLPLVIEKRAVKSELGRGENLENAARRIRYDFLRRVRDSKAAGGLIATGHTLDDQLETLLLRLERGAGIRGLRGILPLRDDGVVRPLLGTGRRVLRLWMGERSISWREDLSNLDVSYRRNHWRLQLSRLPAVQYRELLETADSLTRHAFMLQPLFENMAGWWLNSCTGRVVEDSADCGIQGLLPGEILLERLPGACHFGPLDQALLDEALKNAGVDPSTIPHNLRGMMTELWYAESGEGGSGGRLLQLGRSIWAEGLKSGLLLSSEADPHWDKKEAGDWVLPLPDLATVQHDCFLLPQGGRIETELMDGKALASLLRGSLPEDLDGRWRVVLGVTGEEPSPVLRYARAGDVMRPFGMSGHKNLADLFGEMEVPRLQRGRLPVLEREGEILWVAGVRAAEGTRIGTGTEIAVSMSFKVANM